jgi:signal transduction histidine kinase/ActR/RegA family two-component response regulator
MAAYALAGGLITLAGWFAQVPVLTDWDNDGIAMFANTAVMSVFAGASLAVLTTAWKPAVAISRILAAGVLAFALATLFQHFTGIDLGIDRLLVRDPWGSRAAVAPGRTGPPASTAFTLLGVALCLAGAPRSRRFVPVLAMLVVLLAMLPLAGFLFDADPLFAFARLTGIALESATIILALGLGVLAIVPERDPVRVLCGRDAAGLLARAVLPVIILLPMLLGWLQIRGQDAGLFDARMGLALLVLALIVVLCSLLWRCLTLIRERENAVARHGHEQASLYRFTDRLHRATSLQEMFDAALSCITTALPCSRASILLFDQKDVMRFAGWTGLSEEYRHKVEGHSPWMREDVDPQPICIEDVSTSDLSDSVKSAVLAEGIRALAFVPVVAGGELAGKFMAYCDAPHSFPTSEVHIALSIARQLGFGIERQRAEEQMREAAQRAEEASRAKDTFLAALSHELRTPLTPALLTIAALEEDSTVAAKVREQLAVAGRNIRLEARLIDDLLDLTRVSHGKLTVQQVIADLHELLRHAEETVRDDAATKRISIQVALDAGEHFVRGDPARLQQVFWNLLKNAVKFTPADGTVTVRSFNPSSGQIALTVQDTGIGIPPEKLERIFRAFDQGGIEARHGFGGLGLGLTISKALVELHGGALRVQSDGRGSGATFSVELATTPSGPVTSPLSREGMPSMPRPRRILVVEDHEPTLLAMTRLLERDGHTVFSAGTVCEALARAASCRFDIVISDLGLPDGTGTELMREIRRLHGCPGIAVSGYGMESDQRMSAEAGFSKHLVKPVDVWQLREALCQTDELEVSPRDAAAGSAGAEGPETSPECA